jgi:hypothetical protein
MDCFRKLAIRSPAESSSASSVNPSPAKGQGLLAVCLVEQIPVSLDHDHLHDPGGTAAFASHVGENSPPRAGRYMAVSQTRSQLTRAARMPHMPHMPQESPRLMTSPCSVKNDSGLLEVF